MEARVGLVAGSYHRDELIVIRCHGDCALSSSRELEQSSGRTCRICSDEVGLTVEGELFVACNECAFPICRTCYEYERQEGSQVCPQCKTRFKRLKGCARVDGDEEEDDIDDVENELNFEGAMRHRGGQERSLLESHLAPQVSLLTDGHMADDDIPQDQLALVPSLVEAGDGSKRIHPLPLPYPSLAVQPRPLDPSKDLAAYGYGSIAWKEGMKNWKRRQEKLQITNDEDPGSDNEDGMNLPLTDARQPLSRKLPIPSSQINPYRVIIIIRLLVLGFFFHYRVTHPVKDAYALWLISVICELWFALSWILDQFPKWLPIDRETYLDRLSLRYEKAGKPSQLSAIDIFVSTVDPLKEPPLVTANTVLSILAVDYPVDKVSCYVSDDGAAMLTFEALSETSEFAKRWVPFCKKFNIEPRAPEWYFGQKINYLKDKVSPSFVKERRAMKREYELFKVRINALVARARKVPERGWTMQDGTPWAGNNVRDHPGMIQAFLGQDEGYDIHGNELPHLVYVSREKIPGFNHHKKAGAMNSLVRVSAVLTNAPYILNLDCDHYINNSKALREAMCFMMDPLSGKKVCYVQFPQRFDGIDKNDRYANRNTIFFDINMKGLDGIQGPIYVGTGCVFNRQALYGYDAPKTKKPHKCLPKNWCCGSCFPEMKNGKKPNKSESQMKKEDMRDQVDAELTASPLMDCDDRIAEKEGDQSLALTPQHKLQKKFGQSPIFVASTLLENGGSVEGTSTAALLQEAIHVISCGYEEKTEWGKEVGWIYGSVTEDILTGFKMHCRGWRSIYCIPEKPAFKGSAPINLSDRLHQVLRWALGSIEIFLSRHCPLWYGYGGGLKWLERLSYINATIYPLTSIPLLAYCTLPALCLLTGKFIIPELNNVGDLWFLSLFICIFATSILEMRWSGVGIDEWWRNEQFWVIAGVSAHLFALFQGLLKVFAGVDTNFTVTSKKGNGDGDEFSELYEMKWTTLLIPPTTLLIINLVGVLVGISGAMNDGYRSWGPLFGKLLFALWVILHLYPFLKGLMGRQNRTPTIVVVWSILLASIFSLLWVRVDPFLAKSDDPFLEECGLECD